jgi:hypothetical protein
MNPGTNDEHSPWITVTDLARERYYEKLLENSRKKLTALHARRRAGNAQTVTMDILIEETAALQAERELKRLNKRPLIL